MLRGWDYVHLGDLVLSVQVLCADENINVYIKVSTFIEGSTRVKSEVNLNMFERNVHVVNLRWFLLHFEKRDSTMSNIVGYRDFTIGLNSYLFMIGWDDWIKKRVDYLSWIEGKGGLNDICSITQNTVLFVPFL